MRKRKDLKVLRGKHAVVVLAGGGALFFRAIARRVGSGLGTRVTSETRAVPAV